MKVASISLIFLSLLFAKEEIKNKKESKKQKTVYEKVFKDKKSRTRDILKEVELLTKLLEEEKPN